MNIKTGTPGPWPQPTSYGRTDAGQFSTVPFEDVDAGKINLLAATYDAAGYNYVVEHGFGKSKLTVQFSYNYQQQGNEVPVDVWEYNGQEAQKDLLSAAVFTGITKALSLKNLELIRQALNGDFSNTASGKNIVQADFTDGDPANSFVLYNLMKAGYTDEIMQVPTIRHTQIVSFIYPITLSKLNVGRIISTATLIVLENPPNWAVTGLPTDIPPGFTTIALSYGWRKCSPTINQIAYRKTQIVQEFQYGLWPTATKGTIL